MDHTAVSPTSHRPTTSVVAGALLVVALMLPSLVTWLYFVALADAPSAVQQGAYGVGKFVQFVLPVVWVWGVLRLRARRREGDISASLRLAVSPSLRPNAAPVPPGRRDVLGVLLGLAFGLAVMGAMAGLYYWGLKPAGLFVGPTAEVRAKVASFGITTVASYAALAVFYSLAHSLLEEYYWRWFVFGHACRGLALPAAIGLSSVGFAAHHVLLLGTYFGYASPLTWLFAAAIVIGGAFWAWLYRSSGSLVGPWLSHALVDAAIFVIGWDLVRDVM
jgi:membrane protease YdiL (CAAX protease family)